MQVLTERRPRGNGWQQVQVPGGLAPDRARSAWHYGKIRVISSLADMQLPDGSGVGPQWLVSVSRSGRRPSPSDVRKALRCFRMEGAEEDNHGPGNARAFFLVVDHAHRVTCECKTTETSFVDADGYRFTCADDPADCGGCDLERITGRDCPRHRPPKGPNAPA